jgi:hypothetical protein
MKVNCIKPSEKGKSWETMRRKAKGLEPLLVDGSRLPQGNIVISIYGPCNEVHFFIGLNYWK